MPKPPAHEQWALRNRSFSDMIKRHDNRYRDWMVTALFYSAVHSVQCLCEEHGINPSNHRQRMNTIKGCFPEILEPYRKLYSKSRDARYECIIHPPEVVEDLKSRTLKSLETKVGERRAEILSEREEEE